MELSFEDVCLHFIEFLTPVLLSLLIGWGVTVYVRNKIAPKFASLDKRLLHIVDTPVFLIFFCLGLALLYNGTGDKYLYYRTLYVISLNGNATIFEKIPYAIKVLDSEGFIYFFALTSEYLLKIGVIVLGWKGITNLRKIYNTQNFDKTVLDKTIGFGFTYVTLTCVLNVICQLLEIPNLDNSAAHSAGSQGEAYARIMWTICLFILSYYLYNKSKKSLNALETTPTMLDNSSENKPQSPNSEVKAEDKSTKRCPYCGEIILEVAKKCKYCGELLNK